MTTDWPKCSARIHRPGVAALPDADRRALAEVITSARQKQSDDLAASFDATLKHIPFPLRGVVKKVLIG